MKKLFTLSLALSGGLAAQAQTLYPGNITNLIARYTFSTTAATGSITAVPDVSGNANNSAYVRNLTAGADFRGMTNKTMVFNGNSVIKVPDAPLLNPTSEITMVALINTSAYYSGVCQGTEILSKGGDDHIPGNYFLRMGDNPSDGDDCFAFDATHYQAVSAFGSAWYYATPTTYVPQNEWYFIASTYNGLEVNIYQVPMDPHTKYEQIQPVATYPLSGSIGTNTDSLYIGMHNSVTHPYWFTGAMDELAIFNRGLNNEEINKIYGYLWGASLSVGNSEPAAGISTYPNPAQNQLNISGQINNAATLGLEVYNTMGQKVLAENVRTGNNQLNYGLNTAQLPAGNYILKLNDGGAIQTTKFSIQR